jgi:hypothetical protein
VRIEDLLCPAFVQLSEEGRLPPSTLKHLATIEAAKPKAQAVQVPSPPAESNSPSSCKRKRRRSSVLYHNQDVAANGGSGEAAAGARIRLDLAGTDTCCITQPRHITFDVL